MLHLLPTHGTECLGSTTRLRPDDKILAQKPLKIGQHASILDTFKVQVDPKPQTFCQVALREADRFGRYADPG